MCNWQGHTNDAFIMASTTALKTFSGSRSRVVPLSTIALSELYCKKKKHKRDNQSRPHPTALPATPAPLLRIYKQND